MKNRTLVCILCLLSFTAESESSKEVYSFVIDENQERFYTLLDTYRCPKCQSSNLSGSNAPIAKDLKREIHRLIEEGKTDEQIEAFLRSRYGDFILYKPALRKNTLILWLGPFILLSLIVFLVVSWNMSSKRKSKDLEAEQIVKVIERTRLKKLFEED
ncbi:MAG TPA: cytochrome c-type biogenesis protein CcmH [Gammaproteobacteria bacterium]|jgi:cytochrome c-type biogenesis protein CcmH|nr:cytochrome c-type biogenesis protein CcmH [Gammaproteobacteria bacterium]HIA96543.1 cytochrome c-type biogenesis protein CcmH [Gammaproteobacteria bacterium]HIB75254.1 cytochrome c-type biogenesis protein CcmH [Gammaproteobacteria bacterium]HIG49403.1 cytochrome c-type biogenesis protein CcmH [Gammaproteobacteria bacterium]HIM22527.1 cytochrome c-type biogenesis protein CcmH [Gammaproteobacteria bacterium]